MRTENQGLTQHQLSAKIVDIVVDWLKENGSAALDKEIKHWETGGP